MKCDAVPHCGARCERAGCKRGPGAEMEMEGMIGMEERGGKIRVESDERL